MAIPSGSGTEVLKRNWKVDLSNTTYKLIDGPDADHIYTVLSVVFYNTETSTVSLIGLQINPAAGADNKLIADLSLAGKETFVWNDKIVLTGTDELVCVNASSTNVDVYCSYIDQHF